MLGRLPDAGRSALLVQRLEDMNDYDLYDVLAELGYGLAPRTRVERAGAFAYKHGRWLAGAARADGGHAQGDGLAIHPRRHGRFGKPPYLSDARVCSAGGLAALKILGKPADILRETKGRMFAA